MGCRVGPAGFGVVVVSAGTVAAASRGRLGGASIAGAGSTPHRSAGTADGRMTGATVSRVKTTGAGASISASTPIGPPGSKRAGSNGRSGAASPGAWSSSAPR